MGKIYEEITSELSEWIRSQKLFFVATAPLRADGLVNCSPKGMDTFRILGPREVGYLDLTGSGIETIAHLKENGRIVFMFCAFEGPPKIVRLYGRGSVVEATTPEYDALKSSFTTYSGARAIVKVDVTRIGDSCGFGVPRYDFKGERDTLVRSAETKGTDELSRYWAEKNTRSIDGLPGLGT